MVKREARGTYWTIYIASWDALTESLAMLIVCFLTKFANIDQTLLQKLRFLHGECCTVIFVCEGLGVHSMNSS